MKKLRLNDFIFFGITCVFATVIYVLDRNSEESTSYSALYSLVILFSWLIPFFFNITTAIICFFLIISAAISKISNGYDASVILIQSFVGLAALMVTFVLTRITINSNRELYTVNENLSHLVKRRTEELENKLQELTDYQRLLEENKITLQQLYNELFKSEKRYQLMVSRIKDYSVIFVEPDGMIRNWNEGAERLTGFERNDVKGMHFYELILPHSQDIHDQGRNIIDQLEEKGFYEILGYRQHKNGSFWFASDSLSRVVSDEGETFGYTWISNDLSELKKKEDEVDNLNRELEAKVERRTKDLEAFVYTVSHDLRAPLRAIKGFSEILINDYVNKIEDPHFARFLEYIEQNSNKMSRLIDDLLTFSRVGGKQIEYSRIGSEMLLRTIYQDLLVSHPEYVKTQVDMIGKFPTLSGDRTLIQQAFTNLFSNALKYSNKSENPHVQILYSNDGKYHVFEFSDNGTGFDPKYTHKLFKVFQRLHDGTEYEGTGIGLAIVKQVADVHSGEVIAESELGKGATFTFKLPHK